MRNRGGIDRESAERMLDAPSADSHGAPDRLAALLSAASAPALPDELAGEDAAVAAFHDARAASPRTRPLRVPGRPGRLPLGRLFSVKVAVVSMAVTVAGGVAMAATTGTISLGKSRPEPSGTSTSGGRSTSGSRSPGSPSASALTPPASPSEQRRAVNLCQTYTALSEPDRQQALKTAAFAPLIAAAGNRGRVAAYCTGVLAGTQGNGNGSHGNGSSQGNGSSAKPKKTKTPPGQTKAPGKPSTKPTPPGKTKKAKS